MIEVTVRISSEHAPIRERLQIRNVGPVLGTERGDGTYDVHADGQPISDLCDYQVTRYSGDDEMLRMVRHFRHNRSEGWAACVRRALAATQP